MSVVQIWQPSLPSYDVAEIWRYSGVKVTDPVVERLLEECLDELEGRVHPRVCYARVPVTLCGDRVDMGFAQVESRLLARHLSGCTEAVVFAATVGIDIDRYIARYTRLSPARAVLLQAIGTERIETLCDAFQDTLRRRCEAAGETATHRVSPGYGDLPLEMQRDIFALLDCPRRIGLSLNDSLLMSPSKSVTAVVGIGSTPCGQPPTGCTACTQENCQFRRTL